MFKRIMQSYAESTTALREFTTEVSRLLETHRQDLVRKNMGKVLPIYLAMYEALGDKAPLDPSFRHVLEANKEKINRAFQNKLTVEVTEIQEADKELSITLHLIGPDARSAQQSWNLLKHSQSQTRLLHNGSLFILTSTTEWFLSQLFDEHFRMHPDALGSKDKFFSLDDLKRLGSINDARESLIQAKVEEIMRGSLEDWIQYLKKELKLSMSYLQEDMDRLVEVFQRRNILVHNGGRVNSVYLSNVAPQLRPGLGLGDTVGVSSEYLPQAIDLLEANFLLVGAELWKKFLPADSDRGSFLIDAAFSHLLSERWKLAEMLSFFLMQDAQIPESLRLSAQLNYWQSLKWQDRYEEVRATVESADFSAKDRLYQLALHALAGRADDFFKIMPDALHRKLLPIEALRDWPIFREMRQDPRYLEVLAQYKGEVEITVSQETEISGPQSGENIPESVPEESENGANSNSGEK